VYRRTEIERKDLPHMIDQNIRFVTSAQPRRDADVASAEPSHIHIPRPSRMRRRDAAGASLEPLAELRDPAAAELTVQAA
jgi:hypothetical protein